MNFTWISSHAAVVIYGFKEANSCNKFLASDFAKDRVFYFMLVIFDGISCAMQQHCSLIIETDFLRTASFFQPISEACS
jgi:hypothetical protein